MSILGNILWFILGGFLVGAGYILSGLGLCLTIIGIPFGWQLMKIGIFSFFPFGKECELGSKDMGTLSIIFNVVWIVLGWWILALVHLVFGVTLCITIIGIPFGLQHFKIAKFSLLPFGRH